MFNMVKIPNHIQAKIDAHNQSVRTKLEGRQASEKRASEIEAELADTHKKLHTAMDATLTNPTPENEAKETELRKKVAELELALTGARERAKHASFARTSDDKQLAIDAIKTAREYTIGQWAKKRPELLQAIADAKKAYLQTLAEYGTYQRELRDVFMTTVRETNQNYVEEAGGVPHLNDPAWGYRSHPKADGHLFTITELDMNKALRGEYKPPTID